MSKYTDERDQIGGFELFSDAQIVELGYVRTHDREGIIEHVTLI